jgi:hypothetical protein
MGFLKSLLTVAFLLLLAHAAPVANPEDKTLWSQSLLLKDQMPSVEYKFGKSIGLWGQHPPPLLDLRDPKYPKAVTKLSEATHYIEPTQGMFFFFPLWCFLSLGLGREKELG